MRCRSHGLLGGLLLAILWMTGAGPTPTLGEILGTGVIMGLLGGGSAGGSLVLARRADRLLGSGDEVGLLEGDSPDLEKLLEL